jgi:dynein heavy chain
MQLKLKNAFDEIKKILCETYEPFLQNGAEIQKIWFKYVQKRDEKIEEALKKAVKNSLSDLSKIMGDDKSPGTPIFKLSFEIENNQLTFKPTTE